MSDEYHIYVNYKNAEDYCDSYPKGIDDLKQQIIQLKDNSPSVEDTDIQIYVLTNLKVKTSRSVQIIEDIK